MAISARARKTIVVLAILGACVGPLHAAGTGDPTGNIIEQGSLANEKLIHDSLSGVLVSAARQGCIEPESFDPGVLAMPEGVPGARSWRERWIVNCSNGPRPIDITFIEDGLDAASWVIR